MTIVDENLQVVEKEPLEIFEISKSHIYKCLNQKFRNLLYMREDIISECAVMFWSKYIKEYDYNRGVTIWKYLQCEYYYLILNIFKKERKNQTCQLDESIVADKTYTNELSYTSLPFYIELTDEQKQILNLKIAGYSYEEIFNLINLTNKTKEKKRPIYRRFVEIKNKITRWYGIEYNAPLIDKEKL